MGCVNIGMNILFGGGGELFQQTQKVVYQKELCSAVGNPKYQRLRPSRRRFFLLCCAHTKRPWGCGLMRLLRMSPAFCSPSLVYLLSFYFRGSLVATRGAGLLYPWPSRQHSGSMRVTNFCKCKPLRADGASEGVLSPFPLHPKLHQMISSKVFGCGCLQERLGGGSS